MKESGKRKGEYGDRRKVMFRLMPSINLDGCVVGLDLGFD